MVLLAKRVSASLTASISTSVSSASLNLKTRLASSRRSASPTRKSVEACVWNAAPAARRGFFDLREAAIYFAKATPIFTLRKRDGAAPWPVPMVCCGWPLPQLGVPQRVQNSREQIASQLFQNSVVIPL